VLLTHADLADRRRYLNARHTLRTLLDLGIVPIVNENDTVAVEELRFGDNDNLSALTAALVEADLLVILSDVDGVHTGDPRLDAGAAPVRVARADDAAVTRAAGTLLLAEGDPLARRKHWIAYTLKPAGTLHLDEGAERALARGGRSLLPSGVRAVIGTFGVGDCVRCIGPDGREFARGLVNYTAAELERLKGAHTREIEA